MSIKVSQLTEDTSPTSDDYVLAVDNATSASKKVTMTNIVKAGLPSQTSNSGKYLTTNGSTTSWATVTAGSGDVTGPGSSTDNAIARFDGTGGKTLQNSAVTVNDTGKISATNSAVTAIVEPDNSGNAVNLGASTDTAVNVQTLGHTIATFSGDANAMLTAQQWYGDRTITVTKAPSGDPQEATNTTMLDLGGGNKEWVDWTLENYSGLDHKASINIAKVGTGTIVPFVIRTWNSDLGNVATYGKDYISVIPLSEVVINDSSQDVNFRVEGDTDANLIFADAGLGRVGIGTGSPLEVLHVNQSGDYTTMRFDAGNGSTGGYFYADNAFGFVVAGSRTATDVLLVRGGTTNLKLVSGGVEIPGTLKLAGAGTPGSSKVLTSDASGNATWQTPTAGLSRTIVSSSGSFTAGAAASTDYVYILTGAHVPTMPTAVGNTNRYTFKNNTAASITFLTTSSQTIDGGSLTLTPNASVDLISDNANWFII